MDVAAPKFELPAGKNTRFGTKCLHRAVAIAGIAAIGAFHLPGEPTQAMNAVDPTIGFDRLFGLGGHGCKQYDDTGRLYLYSKGLPSPAIVSWLQRSDNGRRASVPMPQELADALPKLPGCPPGKHHAAMTGSGS